jgi:hypothetical protein
MNSKSQSRNPLFFRSFCRELALIMSRIALITQRSLVQIQPRYRKDKGLANHTANPFVILSAFCPCPL